MLDDPGAVRREWKLKGDEECICQYYDTVCVYGYSAIFNPVHEYEFSNAVEEPWTMRQC